METKEVIAEGSSKKVFATNQNDQVVVEFQEVDGGGKSKKKDGSGSKSGINNAVSAYLFEYLESYNVPTHFMKVLDANSFLAQRADAIPLVVKVYNVASGDLSKRFGIDKGKILEFPVVEIYLKGSKGQLEMINEYHAYALGLCDRKEMTSIMRIATKVNAVLKSFFDRRKIKLVSFQLEFGRSNTQILLVDEVSLDTLQLAIIDDAGKMENVDKLSQRDMDGYTTLQSSILG